MVVVVVFMYIRKAFLLKSSLGGVISYIHT